MITIDAGNEIVAVFCLFLICLGLACALVFTLAIIVQARAYHNERKQQAAVGRINSLDGVLMK